MPPNSEPNNTLHIVDALPIELTTTTNKKQEEQGGALIITTANTTNKTDDAKRVSSSSSSTVVTRHNMLRPLHCEAQQYAWGRLGSSSTVARMKEAQAVQEDDNDFYLEETKPYAELWLGTHPAGMSRVTVHAELEHHAGSSTMSLDGGCGSSITDDDDDDDDDDAASNESPVTNSSSYAQEKQLARKRTPQLHPNTPALIGS